jgi:tetratricopeptide (TPR) repeat protein
LRFARAVPLAACVAFATACAGSNQSRRRDPNAPLTEATPQETVRTLASVPWEPIANQGEQYAQTGDFVRAEQYLAAALERGGPIERILPRLLRVCIAAQRYRAAIEYARPFLERRPDIWQLQYLLATIHMGLNEPQSARARLELVLRYNPHYADAEFDLGKIYRDDLGDAASADEHFRRYLELEPNGSHADEAHDGVVNQVQVHP